MAGGGSAWETKCDINKQQSVGWSWLNWLAFAVPDLNGWMETALMCLCLCECVQAHSNETIGSIRWKIAEQLSCPVDNVQIFANDSMVSQTLTVMGRSHIWAVHRCQTLLQHCVRMWQLEWPHLFSERFRVIVNSKHYLFVLLIFTSVICVLF